MWRTVKLGDICMLNYGKALDKKDRLENAAIPVYGANGIKAYTDKLLHDKPSIIIGRKGSAGELNKVSKPFWALDVTYYVTTDESIVDLDFLFYALLTLNLPSMARGIKPGINRNDVYDKSINLPPLSEQERIVAKLDAAFAEIDEAIVVASNKEKNAEKLFENYLSNIFQINNQDWKSDNLENITSKIGSGATPRGGQASYKKDGISLIRSMNVHDMYFKYKNLAKIDNEQASKLSNVTVQENDILLNITGASVARCCLVERDVLPARVNQHVSIIRVKIEIVIPKFIVYGLISKPYKDKLLTVGNSGGATRQAITKTQIEDFIFYYPKSKEEQNNLITKLDSVYLHTQNLAEIYKKQIKQHVQLKLAILYQELQSSEAA